MPNWNEVFNEIGKLQQTHISEANQAIDRVRRNYLLKLNQHTKRNVISYYSGFLSKPGLLQSSILDEDKNGFMMAVHNLDRSQGLDLLIHTPGGSIDAMQSIVNYLHKMFNGDIRAVVPQIAMSAGTMIACSCKSILMGTHSNLGPIDPHLRDVPTYGVIEEFKRAYREIKQDPSKLAVWDPILRQYRPTFLSQCENAIKWSNAFVQEQLETAMFKGEKGAKQRAASITKKLADYQGNKTHSRHIHAEECEAMGLKIERLEQDEVLQDLVLTVHHCYMHTFMNTPAIKVIENHIGAGYVKNEIKK